MNEIKAVDKSWVLITGALSAGNGQVLKNHISFFMNAPHLSPHPPKTFSEQNYHEHHYPACEKSGPLLALGARV